MNVFSFDTKTKYVYILVFGYTITHYQITL